MIAPPFLIIYVSVCFISNSLTQKFCKNVHTVSSGSISELETGQAMATGFEAMPFDYLYLNGDVDSDNQRLYLKVERKRGNGSNATFEVLVKLELDERYIRRNSGTQNISIGLVVRSVRPAQRLYDLMGTFSCQLSRTQLHSGWMPFERILSRDEYVDTFGSGARITVFDFCE